MSDWSERYLKRSIVHRPEPDPYSRFEDEGIPDLQGGRPEQEWAIDPEEEPLPGDRPTAIDDYGTTAEEQLRGEPLDLRLAREVPEAQPVFGPDAHVKPGRRDEPPPWEWEDTRHAGRIIAPDEGIGADREDEEVAWEAGPDAGGYSAEEAAMHIKPN
jgi:hypothetical protein